MTNIERLQAQLAEKDIECLLVSENANVNWATGFTGSFGFILVTPTAARFVSDSRYTLQAEEQVGSLMPTFTFAAPATVESFLAGHLKEMGVSRVSFEAAHVSYATFEKWRDAFAPLELVSAPDLIGSLRMVKSADEIEKTRAACKLADACWTHVSRLVRPGISEYDLGLEIEFYFRRSGAELAFDPIVVSGERSARPHGRPSEKLLERGDFVTFDFGAKLEGLCSDLTRTIVVQEATDRHREVYDLVLQSQLAAMNLMKPGASGKDVDAEARRVMGDHAKYFGHGLGHGLGRVVHDGGRLGTSSTDVLAVGQIWTVEPGIYIPGFGGVRIEDDIVVTEDGIEVLTHSPKGFTILPE